MTYKIAFLNPWRNASENQAYQSLRVAAARVGCTLIGCSNSMEIEACDPDYVLAVASTQPKLTRHPTFGVIHEPRERFLLNREYFNNLLTYDGYFTIMDTLHTFLQNVLAGIGRECEIGFYFDAPQRLALQAPVEALAGEGAVKLTYFGTNWDSRQRELFIQLDREGLIDVYGPPAAWAYLTGGSYRGVLPFDGEAPQRAYAGERGGARAAVGGASARRRHLQPGVRDRLGGGGGGGLRHAVVAPALWRLPLLLRPAHDARRASPSGCATSWARSATTPPRRPPGPGKRSASSSSGSAPRSCSRTRSTISSAGRGRARGRIAASTRASRSSCDAAGGRSPPCAAPSRVSGTRRLGA